MNFLLQWKRGVKVFPVLNQLIIYVFKDGVQTNSYAHNGLFWQNYQLQHCEITVYNRASESSD